MRRLDAALAYGLSFFPSFLTFSRTVSMSPTAAIEAINFTYTTETKGTAKSRRSKKKAQQKPKGHRPKRRRAAALQRSRARRAAFGTIGGCFHLGAAIVALDGLRAGCVVQLAIQLVLDVAKDFAREPRYLEESNDGSGENYDRNRDDHNGHDSDHGTVAHSVD